MKSLQIGDNDLVGNKFNGHDLHLYLRENNVDATHLVATKHSDNMSTYSIFNSSNWRKLLRFTKKIEQDYSVQSNLYPFSFDILNNELFLNGDVVHYHLLHNNFFNLNVLPLMCQLKPSILSIHDPWITTGHCVYSFHCEKWKDGCGDCPDLNIPFNITKDNTALNFELKRQIIQNSRLTLIVASQWMMNLVAQSPVTQGLPIYHIPHGINHEVFCPAEVSLCRSQLEIDDDAFVLFFRADKNPYKGLDIIDKSLSLLNRNRNISILTVGEKGLLKHLKPRYQVIEFDWLKDDRKLASLYQACDLFLMPSKQEAFGMMAAEAMSCGKPVLAIEGTSLEEVINAPECGVVTKPDSLAYNSELERLMSNPTEIRMRGEKSLNYARNNYNDKINFHKIFDLYNNVIAQHEIDSHALHVLAQLKKHMLIKANRFAPVQKNSFLGLFNRR